MWKKFKDLAQTEWVIFGFPSLVFALLSLLQSPWWLIVFILWIAIIVINGNAEED